MIGRARRLVVSAAGHFVLGVLALALLSCGNAEAPTRAPVFKLSVSGNLTADAIEVRGQSNLPDGALIWIYAWHEAENPGWDWEGRVAVDGGFFSVQVPVRGWGRGLIHAVASFSVRDQPGAVLEAVGNNGEHLVGGQVLLDEAGVRYLTAKFDVIRE